MKKNLLFCLVALSVFVSAQTNPLSPSRATLDGTLAPFYHGVASGDPLTDRVILWTRITSNNNSETVGWQIATDTTFSTIVNSGTVSTDASRDYTVKVDATGLNENTWYYYRFSNNGTNSIIGRTRTAPSGNVSNLRFAVLSCSNHQNGFFNAYRDIVNKNDLDAVIHLGDYYYEYGPDDFSSGIDSSRITEPYKEIWTLADYRQRNSFYRLDQDLRAIHQQFPFIMVWDDHESANNSWSGGAQNHTDSVEGYWPSRKDFSRQSYFEWMPIRDVHNSIDTIHRIIPLGNLADLIMVDTRLEGRDVQAGTTGATVTDTNRTLLVYNQLEWFKQKLSSSTAKWKIIGNQVMFAPLVIFGNALNEDQWDGYPAERNKIIRYTAANQIDNLVVLTGDIHTSWANDVPNPDLTYNAATGSGSAMVEFVCTSVTSGSGINLSPSLITSLIPHVKYVDLAKRGYLLLDVTDTKVQGDWIYMSTIATRTFTSSVGASWCDLDGDNHLTQCATALTPRGTNPTVAPIFTGVKNLANDMVMISIYPNPSVDEIAIQYYLYEPSKVELKITDISGKTVFTQTENQTQNGLFKTEANLSSMAAGTYLVSLTAGGKVYAKRVVKAK